MRTHPSSAGAAAELASTVTVSPYGGPLWTSIDIARYLRLGKSAAHDVIASHDFPAPVVGGSRYRRYLPEHVIAWAQRRAAMNDSDRRQPRPRAT